MTLIWVGAESYANQTGAVSVSVPVPVPFVPEPVKTRSVPLYQLD